VRNHSAYCGFNSRSMEIHADAITTLNSLFVLRLVPEELYA